MPHVNYQMGISVFVFSAKLLVIIVKRPYIDTLTDLIQGVMAVVSLVVINIGFFAKHDLGKKEVLDGVEAKSLCNYIGILMID